MSKDHSEWSPSSAERWIACPASIQLARGVPRTEAGQAAKIGTAVHALSDMALMMGEKANRYIGEAFEGIAITDEMAGWAQVYIDFVESFDKDESFGAALIEERVVLANPLSAHVFGTTDCVIWSDTECVVADLKTGQINVEPDSAQLKLYACAVEPNLPESVKDFSLVIVQPTQPQPIKTFKITRHDLNVWRQDVLFPAIKRTLDPNPDIVEGEHCRWCPARSACPKKREAVAVIAKAEVDAMDSDAMNALLNMAVDAQQTIEAIQKRAFKFLESGKGLEDWTLVAKRATRKWSNEKEVMSRVEEIPGTVKRMPITPAQMEKQFPDMYQSLAELVTAESSGLTLGRKDAPNITA